MTPEAAAPLTPEAAASLTPEAAAPFFIVGYPRSGTTLFRRMLDAHPDLFVPREADPFQRIPPILGRRGLRDAADLARLTARFPPYYAETFDLDAFAAAAAAQAPLSAAETIALLNRHARVAAAKPGARWGHKEPHEWPFVYRQRVWYPSGQFLHIARRPHDVVASIQHHMARGVGLHRFRPPPAVSAWHWRAAHRSVSRQGRALGPRRYLALRYEDLIAEPERRLREVCAFLGVDAAQTPRMLAYHETTQPQALADKGAHMAQSNRPVSGVAVDRGGQVLTAAQLADVDHICRAELAALGWPPAAAAPVSRARGAALDAACVALDAAWAAVRAGRRLRGRL